MYSQKKVPFFQILKLLLGGTLAFGLVAAFVIPRLELHSSMQKAFGRNGKSIIHDYFRYNLTQAKSYLGDPNKTEELRIEEKVVYWNYDPVTLQLHFHKNRVLRVAYFTSDSSTLKHLRDELREFYGSDRKWRVKSIEKDGSAETVLINDTRHLSLVETVSGVFVYGYVLKTLE